MNKHVLIIYTGGTVGMQRTKQGFEPAPGFLTEILKQSTEFQHKDLPDYTIHECSPLLDSSDIGPLHWNAIGSLISDAYTDYDGFIIIHGTDTMAYTASALSFMFNNLDKPIILTGSQVPLAEVHTDARENLLATMLLAADPRIHEVCIYFNNQLLRGNRSHKIDAKRTNAFLSPNYPPLAEVGANIQLFPDRLIAKPSSSFSYHPLEPASIACVSLFPGISYDLLMPLLDSRLQALILLTYGAGNAPIHDPSFTRFIRNAVDRGIIVANKTQCLFGGVNMATYQNGRLLSDAGVISTWDMTLEATVCKLHYLLTIDRQRAREQLEENYRGELSCDIL